jgi:hypothetical protein
MRDMNIKLQRCLTRDESLTEKLSSSPITLEIKIGDFDIADASYKPEIITSDIFISTAGPEGREARQQSGLAPVTRTES